MNDISYTFLLNTNMNGNKQYFVCMNEIKWNWTSVNDIIYCTQMRVNDIHSKQMRVNNMVILTFLIIFDVILFCPFYKFDKIISSAFLNFFWPLWLVRVDFFVATTSETSLPSPKSWPKVKGRKPRGHKPFCLH